MNLRNDFGPAQELHGDAERITGWHIQQPPMMRLSTLASSFLNLSGRPAS